MKNLKKRVGWFLLTKFEIRPMWLLEIVWGWAFKE